MSQSYMQQSVQRTLEQLKNEPSCTVCLNDQPHTHHLVGTDKWIGVDFDGTLSDSDGTAFDHLKCGIPVPKMVARIRDWLKAGYTVKLFTARMAELPEPTEERPSLAAIEMALRAWCKEHIGQELECTAKKDPNMEVLWDDRAVGVVRNQGVPA